MKFLCDRMLGTLAKWLRIYGYDTFYADNGMDDAKLLEMSKKENRILITRDKTLNQVARRENIKTIEIKTTDIDEQINAVLVEIKLDKKKILSRCICVIPKSKKLKKKMSKKKSLKEFLTTMTSSGFARNVIRFIGKVVTTKK